MLEEQTNAKKDFSIAELHKKAFESKKTRKRSLNQDWIDDQLNDNDELNDDDADCFCD